MATVSLRRGTDWGSPGEIPDGAVRVDDDAALADLVGAAFRAGREPPPVCLLGGDLARTLGARPDRPRVASGRAARFRVDAGVALLDGRRRWFVAHLLVARRLWRGSFLVVANAAFRGEANIAPRAHPGDGRLDTLQGRLGPGQRWEARRRLVSGTHVPHPDIRQARVTRARYELDPRARVVVDGRHWGRGRELLVRVEPGAVEVWV